ncbi:glycoside hydrolase, partial [Basidiobolus meristosporus CBS 931.73]
IALIVTNVFEHATKTINYNFCENIGDGRGFTCGSVGFTTGTGDLYTLVTEYQKRVGETGFGKYLPELNRLASSTSCSVPKGDVSQLGGFPDVWKKESCQVAFRKAQDDVSDFIYFLPAMELAAQVGVRSVLGRSIFY